MDGFFVLRESTEIVRLILCMKGDNESKVFKVRIRRLRDELDKYHYPSTALFWHNHRAVLSEFIKGSTNAKGDH